MVNLAIAITTAPRDRPTVERSMASLRSAGFKDWVLVSVDGPVLPDVGDDPRCTLFTHAESVNVAKHWVRTLRLLLDATAADLVLMLQDDTSWAERSAEAVSVIAPRLGDFFTFYVDPTVGKYLGNRRSRPGAHWSNLGRRSNGALCYGFRRAFAERLLADPAFQADVESNARGIDKRVPGACLELGARLQVWTPSLVNHQLGAGNSSIKPKPPKDTKLWEPVAPVEAWAR